MNSRVARTRATVMNAATDLLVEGGPEALTVDGVVARSGVAKTTIYRHWESRDALVQAVFVSCAPTIEPPADDATFDEKLAHIVSQLTHSLTDERWQKLFPEMLRLRAQNPELAKLSDKLDDEQTNVADDVLAQGIAEGRLPAWMGENTESAIHLLLGPIVMAAMVNPSQIDDELRARSIAQFLAGAEAELGASAGR